MSSIKINLAVDFGNFNSVAKYKIGDQDEMFLYVDNTDKIIIPSKVYLKIENGVLTHGVFDEDELKTFRDDDLEVIEVIGFKSVLGCKSITDVLDATRLYFEKHENLDLVEDDGKVKIAISDHEYRIDPDALFIDFMEFIRVTLVDKISVNASLKYNICMSVPNIAPYPYIKAVENGVKTVFGDSLASFQIVREGLAALVNVDLIPEEGDKKYIATIDMGHGTLDLTCMKISKFHSKLKYEVLTTEGSSSTAGLEMTLAIKKYIDDLSDIKITIEEANKIKHTLPTNNFTNVLRRGRRDPWNLKFEKTPEKLRLDQETCALILKNFLQHFESDLKRFHNSVTNSLNRLKEETNIIIFRIGGGLKGYGVKEVIDNVFDINPKNKGKRQRGVLNWDIVPTTKDTSEICRGALKALSIGDTITTIIDVTTSCFGVVYLDRHSKDLRINKVIDKDVKLPAIGTTTIILETCDIKIVDGKRVQCVPVVEGDFKDKCSLLNAERVVEYNIYADCENINDGEPFKAKLEIKADLRNIIVTCYVGGVSSEYVIERGAGPSGSI